MNLNTVFVSAETLPENKLLGRIAVNEENVLGFLINVKTINNTKIYVGFDLEKGTEWVSLAPLVMTTNMSIGAVLDMFYALKDIKRRELKPKVDISISPPMSTGEMLSDMEGASWSKFSFDNTTPPDVIQDFFNKLFGGPLGVDDSPTSYNDNDFKIDNDDEDRHNKN